MKIADAQLHIIDDNRKTLGNCSHESVRQFHRTRLGHDRSVLLSKMKISCVNILSTVSDFMRKI